MNNKHLVSSLSILALAGSLNTTGVLAQDDRAELMEEVITTGTRTTGRTATESAAPVDVVTGADFVNQGDTDLSNLLRNIVPSYNVNTQPISDAASIVRPANLRGLAPDHTLVLVNGKRRHRAAVIYWLGNGVSDGAQGPDISAIPSIALKQAEVLRDGAAAQYGSDAIAGVMNFILKDDSEGGSLQVRYGEFYEGDGELATISGNIGMPFTASGFANFSFEYGNTNATDRSIQRSDAAGLIASGNTDVADPAQEWGQPKIRDELKMVLNLGLDLDRSKNFYGFANYQEKKVEGGFYFRNPDTRSGVFGTKIENDPSTTADDQYQRLVADLNPDNGVPCPTMIAGDAASNALLAQVMDNSTAIGAECFVFNELFPGGFTPRFGGKLTDFAGVAGVRGETAYGMSWDISAGLGYNDVDFFIRDTVNASLGPQTPTEFDPGAYTQFDKNFNVDVSYPLAVSWLASDLNVAGGLEYREEQFEITVGDQASFEIGEYADQGFSAASNGFPGFGPLAGGEFDRANFATYVDAEADILDNWLVGLAVRWEDFEDFGSTTNYKLATNVALTDFVSLRASYSTGFRAPTPGQSNAFNVSTEFDEALGDLVNNGTIPSINPVARLRGGQALDAEKSKNTTFGLIFNFDAVTFTVDYFKIKLKDRISLSQLFELNQTEIDDLVASGVTSAANLQNFRFFTNDFDTTTTGVDIVATTSADWLGGTTDFSLAYNMTKTEVDSIFVDPNDKGSIEGALKRTRQLEEGLPETRWNISANHMLGDWRFLLRLSYYDEFYDSEDNRTYGDEFIVDAEVAYDFNTNYSVTLGTQNLLDEYPDENPTGADDSGRRYSQFSPSGFGGGFWYMRMTYNFD